MKKCVCFAIFLVVCSTLLMGQQQFVPKMVERSATSVDPGTVYSQNREFYGVMKHYAGNPEFVPIDHFTLKERSGRIIYEKTDFGHTLVDISNNGEVVGIDFDGPLSGAAVLHFYDLQGEEVGVQRVGFLRERRFTESGNLYCVNDGKEGLRVFRQNGNALYHLGTCNWFNVSFDGKYIGMANETEIIILENGLETARIPLSSPFVRQIQFSHDGSMLGYLESKEMHIFDIRLQKAAFSYHEENRQLLLVSFDISPDNTTVIMGLTEDKGRGAANRHEKGHIYLYDMNGSPGWKGEMLFPKWNAHIPRVRFRGNNAFSVTTVDDIFEYEF